MSPFYVRLELFDIFSFFFFFLLFMGIEAKPNKCYFHDIMHNEFKLGQPWHKQCLEAAVSFRIDHALLAQWIWIWWSEFPKLGWLWLGIIIQHWTSEYSFQGSSRNKLPGIKNKAGGTAHTIVEKVFDTKWRKYTSVLIINLHSFDT